MLAHGMGSSQSMTGLLFLTDISGQWMVECLLRKDRMANQEAERPGNAHCLFPCDLYLQSHDDSIVRVAPQQPNSIQ